MGERRVDEARTAQLRARLDLMQQAASAFRQASHEIKSPAFQDFSDMLAEYVGLCREATQHGLDFERDPRGSQVLPVRPHNVKLLRERIRRVYGIALDAMMGSKATVGT